MQAGIKHNSISIRGIITLTAHAHQTAPDGKTDGLTPQMKTSVVCDGKLVDVPFITANSIRGMIRRAAGGILVQQLEAAGEQISRNVYLSIMRGSYARTGLNAGGASYRQLIAASEHPFAGLFGGGAFMYPSKLRIERDLFPMVEATRNFFPERFQSSCVDIPINQLIQKTLIASRDDFQRLPQGAFIEDMENAYLEHMGAKLEQNAAKKLQKADAKKNIDLKAVPKSEKLKTSDLNTFNQVECIIAGTPMYFGASARGVTDAQVGLLLSAIQIWANANALGGGSCRGRGSFKAALSLCTEDSVLIDNLFVGDVGSYELSSKAAAFVSAFNETIDAGAASAKSLAAIYPSEIKNDEVSAKGTDSTKDLLEV